MNHLRINRLDYFGKQTICTNLMKEILTVNFFITRINTVKEDDTT